MTKCLYCENGYADTFFAFDRLVCRNCQKLTHRERIENRLRMWQQNYPPGDDFTGDGHEAPPTWTYNFWRQCDFTDEQLRKVEPILGHRTLTMRWCTFDDELLTRSAAAHENDADETADHPRRWDYALEFGNENELTESPVAYFWRSNTIGIPARHWEPREGGAYISNGIPGEYIDHPQPAWAVLDGLLVHNPTVDQVRHFVDTGELPTAQAGQMVSVE